MAWRKGHGKGAGKPRIEVLPVDELPQGARADLSRDEIGALRRQLRRELARLDGMTVASAPDAMKPHLRSAIAWREQHAVDLALNVGGGMIGSGPLAILSSATMQLAGSRYHFVLGAATNDPRLIDRGSRLANDHRQNMMAVHELVAREAIARAESRARPKKSLEESLEDERRARAEDPPMLKAGE